MYREMGMTYWLEKAEAELNVLSLRERGHIEGESVVGGRKGGGKTHAAALSGRLSGRGKGQLTTDARLWHPWLRIQRLLRDVLGARWDEETWAPR
jgi:hypothetical protein